MSTTLTQAIECKAKVRRAWQGASFDEKITALIRLQRMAQEMAQASGRRFHGVIWEPTGSRDVKP